MIRNAAAGIESPPPRRRARHEQPRRSPAEEADILVGLKCGTCELVSIQPIYKCQTGHLFCGICAFGMEDEDLKCRSTDCDDAVINKTRQYSLEEQLSVVSLICRNCPCPKVFQGNLLKEHLDGDVCEFRAIKCNLDKCDSIDVPFREYASHFSKNHELAPEAAQLGNNGVAILQCYSNDFKQASSFRKAYLEKDGLTFFLNYDSELINRELNHYLIYFWVTALLAEEEAEKFEFSLRFCNRSQDRSRRSSLQWKIRAHSIHHPFCKIMDKNDVGSVSSKVLVRYADRFQQAPVVTKTSSHIWSFVRTVECEVSDEQQ